MKGFLSFTLLVFVLSARAQDTTQHTPYELLSSYYDKGFKPFAKKKWFEGAVFSGAIGSTLELDNVIMQY